MQIALFTTRKVDAMEELTWVRGGDSPVYDMLLTFVWHHHPTFKCLCCFRTMALTLMTVIMIVATP